MLTTGLALLIALLSIALFDVISFQHEMKYQLSKQADFIRQNCTAALIFQDKKSIAQNLAFLKTDPNIRSAYIFTKDGKVFTKYLRDDIIKDLPQPGIRDEGIHFEYGHLVLFRNIFFNEKKFGTIYLQYDLKELIEQLKRHFYLTVLVLIPVFFLALLLSSKLQNIIVNPILQLTENASQISSQKDYSIRAVKRNHDEIGTLVDQFNEMLSQIQKRDKALHATHEKLEEHVKQLEIEISERKQVEEKLQSLNGQLNASQQQLSAANQQLSASIQQLKASDEILREREERIRSIIETALDAVITIDSSGKIIGWNNQAEKIFGWSLKEVLGQKLSSSILPPTYRDKHINGLKSFLVTGKSRILNKRNEFTALHRDNHEFPVEISISPTKVGESYIFSAYVRDITERKRTSEELQRANLEFTSMNVQLEKATIQAKELALQAELANKAKSEFLANMSHEIRTPMNSIIGMTEFTLDTELTSEQKGYLNVVKSSSEGLLSLINDILDFSKIEAGQMEIEEIEFNIIELVEGAAEMFALQSEAKNVELLCYLDPEIPTWIVGDPTRLRQILINLLSNAIKFTEEGEVVIKVELSNLQQDKVKAVELIFSVSDTGIGISQEHLKKIFDKFSQADTSITRKFGGTGLGINISNLLIKLMGGELKVDSKIGKWSTFQFNLTLPVATINSEQEEHPNSDFSEIEVMVVVSNDINRFLLRKTLMAWNCKVKEAQNGREALATLSKRSDSIDLIIIDHQLPEMEGIDLARKIRKKDDLKNIKIILLSTIERINSKLMQELEISNSISKPVKQSKLLILLLKTLGLQKIETTESVIKIVNEDSLQKVQYRILFVDDNPDNLKLGRLILEKAGYIVDMADNGKKALSAAKTNYYNLILMDIQMPVMDGFKATKAIRLWEKKNERKRVHIVALTAHAISGYREICLANGMDDYITKPLKKKILIDTVVKWLAPHPKVRVVDDSLENQKLLNG